MLALVVNLFNFFGSCVYVVFVWSYSIGKVMFTFSHQAINLFFSLIWSVASNMSILFDEFVFFWSELENNINKGWLGLSESADEVAKGVARTRVFIGDAATGFLNVRKLRLEDFGRSAVATTKWLFNIIQAGLSLLSEILWFLVTLLPNILIYLCSSLASAVLLLLDTFTLGYKSVLSLFTELFDLIIERVRTKPLRCFVEVFVVMLIIVNSVIILKILQQFARLLYQKVRRQVQKFYAAFLRRRQSMRLPPSSRTRQPLAPEISISRRSPTYNKPDLRRSSSDSDKLNEETEGILCVVCHERPRCIVLFPCKHLCLCEECSFNLAAYQKVCPLCRIYINNQLRVYV